MGAERICEEKSSELTEIYYYYYHHRHHLIFVYLMILLFELSRININKLVRIFYCVTV